MAPAPPGQYSSLQGIRGIAIILVLSFHLFPKFLTNGFVGVDMFFVLSGFLMTKILSSKPLSIKSILLFYKKRFQRVLPLYFLTILLTSFGVLAFVVITERADFIEDVKWSLAMALNYKPIFEHRSYWDQISSIRFLTHLWSLCVEFQYYLLVPIIHFISSGLPFKFRLIAHAAVIFSSCLFQYQTPFELSYSFIFSRVWQFLLGSLAFEISKKSSGPNQTNREKAETWRSIAPEEDNDNNIWMRTVPLIFSVLIIFILVFPFVFKETLTRIIMSFLVAYICGNCMHLEKSYLSLKPLVYVGNISYALYLVHWPVINFVRYIQIKDTDPLSILEALTAIAITVVISLGIHYTLEKKFPQLDFIISFGTVCLCAGMTLSIMGWLKTDQCWMQHTLPKEIQNRVTWNFDKSNLITGPEKFPCDPVIEHNKRGNNSSNDPEISYCRVMSGGVGKILVIGNSLAIRAFPAMIEKFDGRFEELRLFARHAAAPLLDVVPHFTKECQEMVENFQPDLLWIVQGMNEIVFPPRFQKLPQDLSFLRVIMQNVLDGMKHNAKIIYIDLPYFISGQNTVNVIAKSLIYGHDLEKIASFDRMEVENQIGLQSLRLQSLDCDNCYFNDLQAALMRNESRHFDYEKGTYRAVIYDGSHISWTGFTYLDDVYQNVVDHFALITNSSLSDSF